MITLDKIAKRDVLDLVKITKEENKTRVNNESLPEVFDSYTMPMLIKYADVLREEFYDIDKFVSLFDDVRYFEEASPIIERLHTNIEISMHNKAVQEAKYKSDYFKEMMCEYYIVNDTECELIDTFLDLMEKHIEASKNDKSLEYLNILARIRDNVDFKYSSNIQFIGVGIPITEEDYDLKTDEYLENYVIRTMYEIANYKNKDFTNEQIYAKVNALAIYLQSLLMHVKDKRHVDEYQMLSDRIPLDSTAKGIVNTAFVQERAMQKKLVKDDENGKN